MHECRVLVVGGSAGSLEVLLKVFPKLRVNLTFAIVIVIHRKPGADSLLISLLSQRTQMPVREVEEKEKIEAGVIYVAPSDYHLLIEKNRTFSLDRGEKVHYSRPSIDVTFESAADAYRGNLVGLLLSGANEDGVGGLQKIKQQGGRVYIQNPKSALVQTMPLIASQKIAYDSLLKVEEIPDVINHL